MSITETRPRAFPSPTPGTPAPGGASTPHPTSSVPMPKGSASGGIELAGRRGCCDTQSGTAASVQPADRHVSDGTQREIAVGSDAGRDLAAMSSATPEGGSLLDPALALAADVLDDLERVRVANENRLRQLTRSTEDVDGELRGFGMDESHPDVARLAALVDTLKRAEHDATLNLQRHMRRHPLGPWAKSIRGAGDKQVARLLALIGDPYIRPEIVREDGTVLPAGPRTVSALWAYTGLHVVSAGEVRGGDSGHQATDAHLTSAGAAPRRARGQRANWSTRAKTRAYLIALSCLKQLVKPCTGAEHTDGCVCSPYRVVYDNRRTHTATTRPDWTDGHAHNDALRVAAKAFLRDMWREAKRIHETTAEEAIA